MKGTQCAEWLDQTVLKKKNVSSEIKKVIIIIITIILIIDICYFVAVNIHVSCIYIYL